MIMINGVCVSVSHKSEGHEHETHGHKTSSEHGEKRVEEEKKRKTEHTGIFSI